MTEDKDLGFKWVGSGRIRMNPEEYRKFRELLDDPPPPSPALILAMKKGRELMQGIRKRENLDKTALGKIV